MNSRTQLTCFPLLLKKVLLYQPPPPPLTNKTSPQAHCRITLQDKENEKSWGKGVGGEEGLGIQMNFFKNKCMLIVYISLTLACEHLIGPCNNQLGALKT